MPSMPTFGCRPVETPEEENSQQIDPQVVRKHVMNMERTSDTDEIGHIEQEAVNMCDVGNTPDVMLDELVAAPGGLEGLELSW